MDLSGASDRKRIKRKVASQEQESKRSAADPGLFKRAITGINCRQAEGERGAVCPKERAGEMARGGDGV